MSKAEPSEMLPFEPVYNPGGVAVFNAGAGGSAVRNLLAVVLGIIDRDWGLSS
jgi:hypothetical protein